MTALASLVTILLRLTRITKSAQEPTFTENNISLGMTITSVFMLSGVVVYPHIFSTAENHLICKK